MFVFYFSSSLQFEEKTEDKAFSRSGRDEAEAQGDEELPFLTCGSSHSYACSPTARAHIHTHAQDAGLFPAQEIALHDGDAPHV